MIRVLVADDQAMVRQGFAALLDAQQDIEVVGQAENGQQAVEMAAETGPDVVLMDVRMPVMDGLEAARLIIATNVATGRSTRVLMLTTFDADDYVYQALKVGASGFLLKDALAQELLQAVRVVASGESLLAPKVTRKLIEKYVQDGPRQVLSREPVAALTEREVEVMTLVGQGLSNQEIAQQLFIAQQTVKTHVSKILSKLELRDRVQMVVLAYDTGLVVPGS